MADCGEHRPGRVPALRVRRPALRKITKAETRRAPGRTPGAVPGRPQLPTPGGAKVPTTQRVRASWNAPQAQRRTSGESFKPPPSGTQNDRGDRERSPAEPAKDAYGHPSACFCGAPPVALPGTLPTAEVPWIASRVPIRRAGSTKPWAPQSAEGPGLARDPIARAHTVVGRHVYGRPRKSVRPRSERTGAPSPRADAHTRTKSAATVTNGVRGATAGW